MSLRHLGPRQSGALSFGVVGKQFILNICFYQKSEQKRSECQSVLKNKKQMISVWKCISNSLWTDLWNPSVLFQRLAGAAVLTLLDFFSL